MRRRDPRPVGHAISVLTDRLAPQPLMAEIQRAWPAAVGELVAAHAEPTAERDGVLVVTCSSAVWAQELDLMAPELIERVNGLLAGGCIRRLRCRALPAREGSR
jgi:predicted nucleic acid-binding Zn ribbon protein